MGNRLILAAMMALAPVPGVAQEAMLGPSATFMAAFSPSWSETLPVTAAAARATVARATGARSATRTIAIHGLVGAGGGLLIGLLLTAADLSDDHTPLVLSWTGIGLAAGVASGAITWLVERPGR